MFFLYIIAITHKRIFIGFISIFNETTAKRKMYMNVSFIWNLSLKKEVLKIINKISSLVEDWIDSITFQE